MNKAQIRDLDLNFSAHPITGDITIKTNIDAIKQSIKTLLLTSLLERPFNVNLNLNIREFLFEEFNYFYEKELTKQITDLIELYETRVALRNIEIKANEQQNSIIINIEFELVSDKEQISRVEIVLERIR
jgi:phage baseplate assembly protein W